MTQKLVLVLLVTGLCCAYGKTINKIIEEALYQIPDGSGMYMDSPFMTMKDDGSILTELDIRVPKEQFEDRMNRKLEAERGRTKRKGIPEKTRYTDNTRWTDKTIPYTVSGLDYEGMANLRKAMDIWSHYTCINFRQGGYGNYVRIQNGVGCNSFVGMLGTGAQIMNLGTGCTGIGTILHEIGHAIGLNHEQQRQDRDDYIIMRKQYVSPSMQQWTEKTEPDLEDDYGVAYDYGSVMHYGADSFASGKEPTMITHDPSWQFRIGNAQTLSWSDIKIVTIMYKCNSHCGQKTCPQGGFLDKNCQCMCPGNPVTPCGTPAPKVEDRCEDIEDQCDFWRQSGMCASYHAYMKLKCPKACGMCGQGCADFKTDCLSRAQRGECKTNPVYMFENCMRSCGVCWGNTGLTGCKDDDTRCSLWASQGQCVSKYDYMRTTCKRACSHCSGGGGGGGTVTTIKPGDCVDSDAQCPEWASQGECEFNPIWMKENCRLSCNTCETDPTAKPPVTNPPEDCTDKNEYCADWAKRGECTANPEWMEENCAKSCGKCGGGGGDGSECRDDHAQCAEWAARGECVNNPEWMPQNCRRSCGTC